MIAVPVNFKILGGDFKKTQASFTGRFFRIPAKKRGMIEKISMRHLVRFDQVDEKVATEFKASPGWGFAGALIAGPLGLVVGMTAGGRRVSKTTDVIFAVEFDDGRRFLAETSNLGFEMLRNEFF